MPNTHHHLRPPAQELLHLLAIVICAVLLFAFGWAEAAELSPHPAGRSVAGQAVHAR
jgi:hypothetical protein